MKTLIKPCKGLKHKQIIDLGILVIVKTLIKPCKGLKLRGRPCGIKDIGCENANKTLQGIKTSFMQAERECSFRLRENANKTLQGIKTIYLITTFITR